MSSGIAGVYAPNSFDADVTRATLERAFEPWERATAVVSGPLAAARVPQQPVPEERVICLLAGRIHNVPELARELGCSGDLSAERVLARGYADRGEELLELLRGSFALLLWDAEERRGVLAQDQVANRTLYYASLGSRLFFASDVAPLLRLLPTRPGPDRVALVHWIANSSPPEPLTLYEGVLKVGFGRLIRLGDEAWECDTYWRPRYKPPARRSRDEIVEELWSALGRAIAARTAGDEHVGIVMSGGIDSSAVAAAATTAIAGKRADMRAYSAVFPGRSRLDESERIDLVTGALGLPSVQIEPGPAGAYTASLEYLRRWALPLSGTGYLLEVPLLARAAADGFTALLDGQGGDELFGFSPYLLADRLRSGRLVSSLRLARSFPNLGIRPPWRHTLHLWRLFAFTGALPNRVHERIRRRRRRLPRYLSAANAELFLATDYRSAWKEKRDGPLWWAYKAGIFTRAREEVGLPEYLRHRAAMAGLDARMPLMDLDLIEFSLSVPPEHDFDGRFDRPLVRQAMQGAVPDEVRLSPFKSNLSPYYHECLAEHDLPHLRRVLLDPDAEVMAYVDPSFFRRLLEHPPRVGEQGWVSWLSPVWCALTAETWLRYQADPDSVERLLAEQPPRPTWRVHKAPPP